MNTPARSLFLALVVLGLGCAHVDFSKLETPTGPALLREVDELEAHVQTVTGSARVQAKSPSGGGETSAFIAARPPGEVHLELLDFFGSPARVLVSDGHNFGLYQKDKGTYLRGPATAAALAQLLPVDISAQDLVAILLGRTPRLHVPPGPVETDTEAQAYRVTLQDGARKQTLWVHPTSKRVLRSVLEGPGGYTLLFEQPMPDAGVPFARKVTFSDATSTVVLRWSTEEVELNTPLNGALFQLTPPAGARTVEMDAPPPGKS
jgi:outer membrane lipoprotein-sorting protein